LMAQFWRGGGRPQQPPSPPRTPPPFERPPSWPRDWRERLENAAPQQQRSRSRSRQRTPPRRSRSRSRQSTPPRRSRSKSRQRPLPPRSIPKECPVCANDMSNPKRCEDCGAYWCGNCDKRLAKCYNCRAVISGRKALAKQQAQQRVNEWGAQIVNQYREPIVLRIPPVQQPPNRSCDICHGEQGRRRRCGHFICPWCIRVERTRLAAQVERLNPYTQDLQKLCPFCDLEMGLDDAGRLQRPR
jgi:hypothetical protein